MAAMLGIPAVIALALVVFSGGVDEQAVSLLESEGGPSDSEQLEKVLKNRNPLAAAPKAPAVSGNASARRERGTTETQNPAEGKKAPVKSDRKWGRKASWNDKRIKMVTSDDAPNAQSTAAIPHAPGIRDYGKDESSDRGMLSVVTRPPGMRVEANGILLGVTPIIRMMPDKDGGKIRVKLSKDGFVTVTESVSANKDGEYHLSLKMKLKNP